MASNGQIHNEMDSIRADLSQLRTDLATIMGNLADAGKVESADLQDKAREVGKRAADITEAQIRERPLLSVFVVFLVGLILGKILER